MNPAGILSSFVIFAPPPSSDDSDLMPRRRICCGACRRRHRRCVVHKGATRCGACAEADLECHFDTGLQFQHTHGTDSNSGKDRSCRSLPIRFVTPEGPGSNTSARSPRGSLDHWDTALGEDAVNAVSTPGHSVTPSTPILGPISILSPFSSSTNEHPPEVSETQKDGDIVYRTPHNAPRAPPVYVVPVPHPWNLTKRQAFLLRTYIDKLAPSSDSCDDARHFTLEVPRLALREPMILNGIFALASIRDARSTGSTSDVESTYYHGRCIKLLIEAFALPPTIELLVAVVLARLYEEFDNETDADFHHLSGTRNLLNHAAIASFVTEGGLAEAASWVHLRQASYVYLVHRRPVDVCLESFERSTVFRRDDDSAHANRAVYLFAKVLRLLFPQQGQTPSLNNIDGAEAWNRLEHEVDLWHGGKPPSFHPIHHEAPVPQNDRPFPTIWMTASAPVMGLQHYYAAKAIFCLHRCSSATGVVDFEAARLRQENERHLPYYLGTLMALALSNEHVINAFYLPAHMLSLCGYSIRHATERAHTITYLQKVSDILQWKTSTLAQSLQRQWEELDRSSSI